MRSEIGASAWIANSCVSHGPPCTRSRQLRPPSCVETSAPASNKWFVAISGDGIGFTHSRRRSSGYLALATNMSPSTHEGNLAFRSLVVLEVLAFLGHIAGIGRLAHYLLDEF